MYLRFKRTIQGNVDRPSRPNERVVQEMFSRAHDFEINNSTFNYVAQTHDAVSTVLFQHIAAGAIFDSAERFPPGKCHPDTRKRIIDRINEWINNPSPNNNVLWLYGPAGAGKSALAHSIAELLRQQHPQRYGGSFFFARGPTDRGKGDKLFSTLAYQLALQIPPMRTAINDALSHDPTLPTKSIDCQLESLIVNPLLECKEWPSHTPTIFIDGLDECNGDSVDGPDAQCSILTLLSEALIKHKIPIRVFIASRPEYWIRDSFDTSPLQSITLPISLRDDIDADKDMKRFLEEGFEEIRLRNMRVMGSVETPWPPVDIIDQFVRDASGQYIYPTTVLKFVGKSSRYCNPQEQLRIITTRGPHRASAFSDLDKLYATILSTYPRSDSLIRVLGGLLADVGLGAIHLCLGVDLAEVTLVLDALSSLINVSDPEIDNNIVRLLEPIFGSPLQEDAISFCHLSFRQFLEDQSRSGPFFVDVDIYREQIARKLLGIIGNNLEAKYKTEPHISHKLGLSVFNQMMETLPVHIMSCSSDVHANLFSDLTRQILEFLSASHIQYPACLMRDIECIKQVLMKFRSGASTEQRLNSIISKLRETAELAWASGLDTLSTSSHLELTPTLVFVDLCRHTDDTARMVSHQIFTIPGQSIKTTLSSLQRHRHIINAGGFLYNGGRIRNHKMYGMSLMSQVGNYKEDQRGWLARGEWDNAYMRLLYQCLDSFMNSEEKQEGYKAHINTAEALLWSKHCFSFLVNTTSEDAFRKSHKVAFCNLFNDPSGWMRLRSRMVENEFEHLMFGLLIWFQSELENPQEKEYFRRYDESLPQRMVNIMRQIFEDCFSPRTIDSTPLIFYGYWFPTWRSFEFLAPLDGSGEPIVMEKEIVRQSLSKVDIERRHRLYQRLFVSALIGSSDEDPIVYPASTIYPQLATFVLEVLVKHRVSLLESWPDSYGPRNIMKDNIETSYVFRCLSYALPTEENLTLLRALRYFYTHAEKFGTPGDRKMLQEDLWCPPVGFCRLISTLITKYDLSLLSTEELGYFQKWLAGLNALEIPHYQYEKQPIFN